MAEHGKLLLTEHSQERRDFLKKAAIGVGAAWVAPTVVGSFQAAAAQGTPQVEQAGCPCYWVKTETWCDQTPKQGGSDSGNPDCLISNSQVNGLCNVTVSCSGDIETWILPADATNVRIGIKKGNQAASGCANLPTTPSGGSWNVASGGKTYVVGLTILANGCLSYAVDSTGEDVPSHVEFQFCSCTCACAS